MDSLDWVAKSYPSITEEQYKALCEITEFLIRKPNPSENLGHILVGFAGTGKTYLVKILTEIAFKLGLRIALSAPTNKAVKELQKLGTGCSTATIYSLLGLRLQSEEEELVLLKAEEGKIKEFDIVVVDECGMVNSQLFYYIQEAMDYDRVKFLFVGDPKQLPPVGESISPVWKLFPMSKLIRVMRHDNQILDLATRIRNDKKGNLKSLCQSNNDGKEGVWRLSSREFEERILEYAQKGLFESKTKAIAWRNATVDRLNLLVRNTIFAQEGKNARYLVGDKLVFTAPYIPPDKNTGIFTDEEATVKHISMGRHPIFPLNFYNLYVSTGDKEVTVRAIHEDDEDLFYSILAQLANEARTENRSLWKNFWDLKNYFCQVKYAYALTAHRSQGSTFENVFVDVNDILANPNRGEARKCLYVAVTRPSKKLFLR